MADPDHFVTCCDCGLRFSMPKSLNDWYRADARRWFFCPKGHEQHYSSDANDIEKIRRERDRLKQDTARLLDEAHRANKEAEAQKRSAAAYKGAATRMKNRAKAGVCPCCNRHFVNLERHMKSQHSDEDLSNVVELGQPSKTA